MAAAVKMAGAFCILSACILVGIELERRLKKRWMFLKEMQELMTVLEKEMTYHRAPVPEAFCSAAGRCTTQLQQMLLFAASRIEKREGKSFRDIWYESVNRCIPAGLLTDEELQDVIDAADALCNTDVVMQKTLLEKYADRFLEMSNREAEVCRDKGGLYRKLTTAAGVFLVILLI